MLKKIGILIGGVAAAQAFSLLISPLLTRLYTPHDFGLLSLILGTGSVIGAAVHGRLTLAIARCNHEKDGREVVEVALLISALGGVIAGAGVWVVAKLGENATYTLPVVLAIILIAICTAHIDVFNYWQSFTGNFSLSATNAARRSISTGIAQIVFAALGSAGLAIGALVGALVSVLKSHRSSATLSCPDFKKVCRVLSIHRTYPLYSMPQGLLASASLNGIPLLLANFYGPAVAGQYWLAYRVLLAPIALIGGSYRQVFHAELSGRDKDRNKLYRRAFVHTAAMAIIIVPVTFVTFCYGADVFNVVYGEGWRMAGVFSGYLVICFSMDIVKVPAITILHSLNRQRLLLLYEAVLAVLRIGLVSYSCIYFDVLTSVQVFTFVSTCAAMFLVAFTHRISRHALVPLKNDH